MMQAKCSRMQCLPIHQHHERFDPVPVLRNVVAHHCKRASPIRRITEDRMTQMLHVTTYLVRAACLQSKFNERTDLKIFHEEVFGYRVLSIFWDDGHSSAVLRMPS